MSFKIGDEVVSTKELFLSIGTKGRVLGCDGHYILVYFKSGILDSGGNELLSSVWLTNGIEKIDEREKIEVGRRMTFLGDSIIFGFNTLFKGAIVKAVQKDLIHNRLLVETHDFSRFWVDFSNMDLSSNWIAETNEQQESK